jgi:hypothetical protein
MTKAYEDNLQKIRDSLDLKKEADITKFKPPEPESGDELALWKLSASNFHRSVVSIALFHGNYSSV